MGSSIHLQELTDHGSYVSILTSLRGWGVGEVGVCFCLILDFEVGSHTISQTGLELLNLQPQPNKCWNYKHAPQYLA